MDAITKSLGTITAVDFGKAIGYFKQAAKSIYKHFNNGVIYATAMVFETGDYAHINKFLPALTVAGLEPKFRRTVVAHGVIPFKYDKDTCQFIGKIQKGRRAALEMVNTDNIPQWEVVLRAALDGELPENKEPAAFKLETRLPNLLKKAAENGYTVQEMRKIFNAALKDVPAPEAKIQEVKKGQQEEAQAQRKAA